MIPLLEERLKLTKRVRETGRVRVSVTTGTEERILRESLRSRLVEVERVPVGREVAEPPPVREEGDTLVIPVLEEVLVVERRLVLREEVRLRLRHEERRHEQPAILRRQSVSVERLPPGPPATAQQHQEQHAMQTITGLFDSRAEAERCVETMVQQYGIDRDRIQVYAAGSENVTAGTTEPRSESHHGFLASLRDLFMPEEDRITYAEGIRRGGIMVSVQAEEGQFEQAMDAFERNGAVDLDSREQEWRQAGWTGEGADSAGYATYGGDAVIGPSSDGSRTGLAATTAATGGGSAPDGAPGNPPGTMLSRGLDEVAGTNISGAHPENEATGTGSTAAPLSGTIGTAAATGGEEVIPVVEERLRVGKRVVGGGRVRVRSYVVETPVQEQVRLREEHVSVERRPVDRPLGEVPADAFRERVIEATETTEEAVVAKEARVVEELRIRKEAEERTQTVSDTVRRTEVEVDDQRTSRTAGTATPLVPDRNPER